MTSEAPERKLLTPRGGLPNGNWREGELVEYVRADLHQQALEAAREEGRREGLEEGIVQGMKIATSVPIEQVPVAIHALIDKPTDPVAEAARVIANAKDYGNRPASYWQKAWFAMREDMSHNDAPAAFYEALRALAQKEGE